MKTDDFEKRLQRVAPREVPTAWREKILTTATQQTQSSRHSLPPVRPSFLAIITQQLEKLSRPHRAAWGSLVTIWIIIATLNFSARDHSTANGAHNTPPPSPEAIAAWRQQRRELAALAESTPQREFAPPRQPLPQPRSSRHPETVAV